MRRLLATFGQEPLEEKWIHEVARSNRVTSHPFSYSCGFVSFVDDHYLFSRAPVLPIKWLQHH